MPPTTLAARSVGAAIVLIVPVVAEILWPAFGDSGHLVFAASQLLGWFLVGGVVIDIARLHPRLELMRSGRIGRRLLIVCCAFQVLFAMTYGASALWGGEPWEPAFVLFLVGFLAQLVGGVVWWRAMSVEPGLQATRASLLATAVLGFLAMAIGQSPWHDLCLLASYAAWGVTGVSASRARVTDRDVVSSPSPRRP